MANKVLYKTKSGDDALTNSNRSKERFDNENTIAQNSDKRSKVFSLEDEGQFAADFQRQHHLNRWGQGIEVLNAYCMFECTCFYYQKYIHVYISSRIFYFQLEDTEIVIRDTQNEKLSDMGTMFLSEDAPQCLGR